MTRLHTEIKTTKLPTYTQDSNQRDNNSLSIPAGAQTNRGWGRGAQLICHHSGSRFRSMIN